MTNDAPDLSARLDQDEMHRRRRSGEWLAAVGILQTGEHLVSMVRRSEFEESLGELHGRRPMRRLDILRSVRRSIRAHLEANRADALCGDPDFLSDLGLLVALRFFHGDAAHEGLPFTMIGLDVSPAEDLSWRERGMVDPAARRQRQEGGAGGL